MEIYKEGIYWFVKNTHGPVPNELKGEWTSKEFVDKAVNQYQARVRSKAINMTQRFRERQQRAASNAKISD
jgi:hypothetical protein